jgi:radical SAM protein with 4Fe4S-binding SPASM domain
MKNITSLGVGLTNRCNLNCPHCYSRSSDKHDLKEKDIRKILRDFPNLKKVNLGTGESILNKDFLKIIKLLKSEGIEIALTSNGYTVNQISNEDLNILKEVDISIDFPTSELHDKWRGTPGTFKNALKAIEKCKKMGVPVSVATTLMSNNYKYLPQFKRILEKYNLFLRINLYKPANGKKEFLPTYDQFWEAIKILSDNFLLLSNSEPILSLVTKNKLLSGSPCGGSARIHPDMKITGCVYLDPNEYSYSKFLEIKKIVPRYCLECEVLSSCRGGCHGRKILLGSVDKPDIYCPFANNKPIPKIVFRKSKSKKKFIHSGYLCTIIVK